MKRSAILLPLLAGVLWAAGAPRAASGPVIAVRAGRVHTVSGGVLERGVILIQDGRILDVRASGEIPEGATVIDAPNETVVPGLVESHTSLADAGRDADESVSQDVRAVDGYDFFQGNRRALAGGVTSVYVAPGSKRLLSGRGAVIKTAGKGPEDRVVAAAFGLRVSLGEEPKNPPALFKPPVRATADDPIRPARSQYPATRMGQFAELRRAAGMPGPLRDGQETLVVSAHRADDLVKAVLLAEELGRKLVLVDAEEAPQVADFLAKKNVPVIFNPGYSPARRDGRDPARPSIESAGALEGAAVLAKAGVRFALQVPEDDDLRDLLFIAAASVRNGLTEEQALRAVTLSPAEILGVEARVGSIAKGKDADLVFLDGAPLGAGTSVRRVMVGGSIVFERRDADVHTYRAPGLAAAKGKDFLAIRGARILTVTQGIIPEGLILIENRKIAYVGRGRPIPPEAKVIDAAGLTAAPGFIDLHSHLGFHLDRTEQGLYRGRMGSAPASLTAPPSKLIRLSEGEFRAVAASGVTSILLAPEGTGVCSVLKLSGDSSAVVREVAALKIAVQGGTSGAQALRDLIQKAKKYHEEWEAYAKAKKEPPPRAPAEGAKTPDPISGTWKGTLEAPEQSIKAEFTAEFKLEGAKVTGTLQTSVAGPNAEPIEGTFEGGELKFERVHQGAKIEVAMKLVSPDHLKGTWKLTSAVLQARGPVECQRTAAAEAGAAAPKAEVKEPRKDDALEHWRPLFRKEIPLLITARDLPAIETAVRVLRDEFDLDHVLLDAVDAPFAGDLLAEKGTGVAVGPDFLQDKKGAIFNAAESLASQGLPIAFHTSGLSSTRTLPLTAAYAVRHGLDAFDALKAVTVAPARMLKLEGRLGSLERGRDADLVLFAGDVFSPTSRVKYVLIDGSIVHEAK